MPKADTILQRKGTAVTTIDRERNVREAAELMNARRIGAVVVTDGSRAVGIFTERDVLTRVVAAGADPARTSIGSVMTAPMAVCRRDTPVSECKAIMTKQRIRHLPVVEDGQLHGLISIGDILAGEVVDQQQTIEYLHEYLFGLAR